MLFLPYKLDLAMEQAPLANMLLVLLISAIYFMAAFSNILNPIIPSMVLTGWGVGGLVGHMFLHAGFMHLLGNMIFLWVFGNGVCAKIGNFWFIILFIGLGVLAAITHNIFSGIPALGASGALYGVIGFYFALHPTNKITCFWSILVRSGSVEISAYLLIGFWVIKDIFGVFGGDSNIAHIAHLGGFVFGISLGYWLTSSGRVLMCEYDLKSLPELISKT